MLIALALQAAVAQATTAPTAPQPHDAFAESAWGFFSRVGALSRRREVVEIATDGRDGTVVHYKLRLTFSRGETRWTNSRTCPAVRPVLASLRDLPTPRPAPPGFGDDPKEILMDGIGYELAVPGAGDPTGMTRLSISSNVQTPLARWVDAAFEQLASCWSVVELRVTPTRKP